MLTLFTNAGWVAWPLGIFSVIALGIVLERLYTLTKLRRIENEAFSRLVPALQARNLGALGDPAIATAPVSQVVATLTSLVDATEEALYAVADSAVSLQRLRLRRYLGTLATVGSTAPFVGLFGTVIGVMTAFQGMKTAGLNNEGLAAGISEALSATALGLLVAIPSVIAYNALLGRAQADLLSINDHVSRLAPLLRTAREN